MTSDPADQSVLAKTNDRIDARRRPHFVTGRLAEPALRATVARLAQELDFQYTIQVMPITVAALMSPAWIAPRLRVPPEATEIILPGYCDTDLAALRQVTAKPLHIGPRDLRALPEFFGQQAPPPNLNEYSIEIIAEINHAPRLSLSELLAQAGALQAAGADVIDVGCEPSGYWSGVAECVRALRGLGLRVSIDSMNVQEISEATQAGAELVLSVNATNRHAATDWGVEVVVIPDVAGTTTGLDTSVETLARQQVPMRIDPIVEPIGCGFAPSLGRYLWARQEFPQAQLMMGIGNLTELTDVDSAGVNLMLLGFCEELQIRSVLTTQVINWACTSVRECDRARRIVHYAVQNRVPPKHVNHDLVMLRDVKRYPVGQAALSELAAGIKDHNYRIFAEDEQLHLLAAQLHLTDRDPFALFHKLLAQQPTNLDPSHAFYLGYELAKAATALTLSKQYRQDEALDWGFLTEPETSHRQRQHKQHQTDPAESE